MEALVVAEVGEAVAVVEMRAKVVLEEVLHEVKEE